VAMGDLEAARIAHDAIGQVLGASDTAFGLPNPAEPEP
jgi:hypothetical protein